MPLFLFNNLTEEDKSEAVEKIMKGSAPSHDFFLMVVLSILMATFGLLLDNAAVIIGSMLIAPILYSILGLSLGVSISDLKLISRSLYTVSKSMFLGIAAAVLATLLFSTQIGSELTPEIMSRTHPSLLYMSIAIIAGFAASFALVKPQLSETLPGIAISVALIPPLAVIGIGIANLNWQVISGSLLLFIVNTIGIVFASMITFSLMNFYVKRKLIRKTIKKEEIEIETQVKKT
ncbi:TIGR00341 family protein [Candidatus Wolfebacteria bacterium]|nr:TIGR00341 family protein [Candidatus Wolfebacteria bacterium]